MDKIRAILEKLGSKELAGQIIECLTKHETELKEKLDVEYKARMAQAQKVCVEEVEEYKKELARKAQVYFESKADKVEQTIAKQVAIHESEAGAKLKEIRALLEGIDLNGNSEAAIRATKTEIEQLNAKIKQLTESRNTAVAKANRSFGIAEQALTRNRELEALTESLKKEAVEKKPVVEAAKPVAAEGVIAQVKPIIAEVKPAGAVSTRRPSEESVAKPVAKPVIQAALRGVSPEAIASQME